MHQLVAQLAEVVGDYRKLLVLIRITFLKVLAIMPESFVVESILAFRPASFSTKNNSGESESVTQRCCAMQKNCSEKFSKDHRKMSAIETVFSKLY